MPRSRVHFLLAGLTVALLCCTSWGPPFGTSRLVPEKVPDHLRLFLATGRRIEIFGPSVSGDTLYGDTLARAAKRIPVGIPFADIDSISQRRIDAPMTVLAVAVAAGGVIAVIEGVEALEKSLQEQSEQKCSIGHV